MNVSSGNRFSPLNNFFEARFEGDVCYGEPLQEHTWYKIGGPALYLAFPKNVDALISLLKLCAHIGVPVCMLGDGANMLVHDNGFEGVIIKLSRYMNQIIQEETFVRCGAGVLLPDLVLWCEKRGLGGLQGLAGVPGTVGGALRMNAGTNRGNIGTIVHSVGYVENSSNYVCLSASDIRFNYRKVKKLENVSITDCVLRMRFEEREILRKIRETQLNERAQKQPVEYPSCGSVFKRPEGHYVGKMVQDLGLKGLRYGNAMISPKHGGFIVNLGGAKSSDVFYLIQTIQQKVLEAYKINLEPEVKFIGFPKF